MTAPVINTDPVVNTAPVVAICVPVYSSPKIQFWRSMSQLWKPHTGSPHFPAGGATYTMDSHGLLVEQARTLLTSDAMAAHETGNLPKVTHVLWIDDDMQFAPHALKQLLSHNLPVVGGLCHNRRSPFNPILARRHLDERGLPQEAMGFVYHLPPNGLVEVDATGGAFLLVRRDVFEAIESKFGELSWWKPVGHASEDFSFCHRIRECGFKIFVDVGLDIGHVGEVVVDRAFAVKNRPYEVNAWVDDPGEHDNDGTPVASIIIPAYNQKPKYLKAAILSAAHQTRHVEVIVVDDGSDPPIPFEGWPFNVKVVRHAKVGDLSILQDSSFNAAPGVEVRPENRGIAEALNTGISFMQTDWFCWLSSDDLLDPRKVEVQLQILRSTGGKASFHRYQSYVGGEGAEPFPRVSRFVSWDSIQQQKAILANACVINGSTVMIHRSVFQEVGVFDKNYKYGQDWEMWCRIGQQFFWYGVEDILGTRREHGNLTGAIQDSAADDPRRLRRDAEDTSIRKRYGV